MSQAYQTLSKIHQITNEVNQLRQKLKHQELSKSSIQQKLNFYDSRIGILTQQRTNRIQNDENQFQNLLTQSNTFREYLKRSDSNNIANLKKMQDHINTVINTMYGKFSTVEQKMLSLIDQKQKILEHMSYQIDNHTVSIKALQDWIKINQGQNRSLSIYQDNMNARFETLMKEFQLKVKTLQSQTSHAKSERQALEQKIKSLDQTLKSKNIKVHNGQPEKNQKTREKLNQGQFEQKINQKVEAMHQKIESFNLQIKKLSNRLNSKSSSLQYSAVKSKNLSEYSANQDIQIVKRKIQNIQANMQNIQGKMQNVQDQIQNAIRGNAKLNPKVADDKKVLQLQKDLKKCQNDIKLLGQEFQTLKQRLQEGSSKDPAQKSNYDSVQRPSNKPFNYQNQYDQYEERGIQSTLNRAKNLRQERSKFQRHNAHYNQSQFSEIDISQMRGGIRGLLKKSKEKQEAASSVGKNKPSALNPLKKKPLPAKKNPLPPMKNSLGLRQNSRQNPSQIYEDQQESDDMYQIDEQGYLVDSEGRYLTNQYGERMQLNSQQINQILKQQGAM